ncbi:uncharacterized protein BO97DRAFT_171020 [Aspergillus homomorphus CBS 101889]|uniref:Uncharacterized protein n=1 Tax=Aspergillus homomorphus (strain CBS 101889) TaxID=1450537 RepID=A0A395HN84_ASPHC|nr:hypothetical protein BO97DRAFT_171020 [Aspergillus homomorphus CBS 101889]RAL09287.1 hypothetical protein BO97DRAFT_171020 [Aspergillus homomorphus CBS 101889]
MASSLTPIPHRILMSMSIILYLDIPAFCLPLCLLSCHCRMAAGLPPRPRAFHGSFLRIMYLRPPAESLVVFVLRINQSIIHSFIISY